MRFIQDAALVAFQPEETIPAPLPGDAARTFLLAMQRVGGDERAGRRPDFLEQRRERGDFVALLRNGNLIQRQPQVMRHGGEQLERFSVVPATAAQDLAVHGQLGQRAHLLLGEPAADERRKAAVAPTASNPQAL